MTKPNLAQLKRMVGNPDVYAVQYVKDGRGQWRPVREPLDDKVLRRHLEGVHTVGTYIGHRDEGGPDATGRDTWQTLARTLVFDIDSGGGTAIAEAVAIEGALGDLGVPASFFGREFSGSKGYHVWVLLQEFHPNAELRRVGRAVLALAGVECEVYPKQDEVRDLGNLVKLPGGIHQVTRSHNDFLGTPPMAMPTPAWQKVLAHLPAEQHARRSAPVDNRFPCLEAIQQGVGEGGRNNQLFHLATMVRRAGLDEGSTRAVIERVNGMCDPPLDDAEVEQLLDSSRTSGPVCDSLPSLMREECGDCCIRQRTSGLFARPGQVRHAGEGESVVVRIGSRVADVVTFEHDDIATAKAALRHIEEKN